MNIVLSEWHSRLLISAIQSLFTLCILVSWNAHAGALMCDDFERAGVDAEVIAGMLSAAGDGHLYRIDNDASRIEFQVRYFPGGRVHGSFDEFEGGLSLAPSTSKVNRALLLIKAGSLTTSNKLFDAIARDLNFLDVERYPEILFVSKSIQWKSDRVGKLYGDLTLAGNTRPIVFDIHVLPELSPEAGRSARVLIMAKTIISRSAFGIRGYPVFLGDAVELNLKFEVLRAIV